MGLGPKLLSYRPAAGEGGFFKGKLSGPFSSPSEEEEQKIEPVVVESTKKATGFWAWGRKEDTSQKEKEEREKREKKEAEGVEVREFRRMVMAMVVVVVMVVTYPVPPRPVLRMWKFGRRLTDKPTSLGDESFSQTEQAHL